MNEQQGPEGSRAQEHLSQEFGVQHTAGVWLTAGSCSPTPTLPKCQSSGIFLWRFNYGGIID